MVAAGTVTRHSRLPGRVSAWKAVTSPVPSGETRTVSTTWSRTSPLPPASAAP